jgi:hypothetical protein
LSLGALVIVGHDSLGSAAAVVGRSVVGCLSGSTMKMSNAYEILVKNFEEAFTL